MDRDRIEENIQPDDTQARASKAMSTYVTDSEVFTRNANVHSVMGGQPNELACETGKDDELRSNERPISGKDDDLRSNSKKSSDRNNDTTSNSDTSSGKDGDLNSNTVTSPGKDD